MDFVNSRAEDETTVEHHYRCDIFMVAVDQQAQELNCRFNKQATELLILCTSLDPKDSFRSFNIDNICSLASKFYPADFKEQEMNNLRCQLRHYENVVPTSPKFQNLTTISELCQRLASSGKSDEYYLIDRYLMFSVPVLVDLFIAKNSNYFLMYRLIRLVLTLPVSTATTERAFSAMKLVKTRLRNKMEDGFLRDCLLIYIEKEIAVGISTDAIIDEFDEPSRRVPFS